MERGRQGRDADTPVNHNESLLADDLRLLARRAAEGDSASRAGLKAALAELVPKRGLTRERITGALVPEGWNSAEAWRFSEEVLDNVSLGAMRGEEASEVTWRRIGAALIDFIPLIVLFFLVAAATGGITTDDGEFSVNLSGVPFFLFLLLTLAYYVILEAVTARTLGKIIMGLKVVKLNGEPYDWRAALIRNVLRIVDGLPIFYIVGLICVAVTRQKQRLGDMAAGTVVVSAG